MASLLMQFSASLPPLQEGSNLASDRDFLVRRDRARSMRLLGLMIVDKDKPILEVVRN